MKEKIEIFIVDMHCVEVLRMQRALSLIQVGVPLDNRISNDQVKLSVTKDMEIDNAKKMNIDSDSVGQVLQFLAAPDRQDDYIGKHSDNIRFGRLISFLNCIQNL